MRQNIEEQKAQSTPNVDSKFEPLVDVDFCQPLRFTRIAIDHAEAITARIDEIEVDCIGFGMNVDESGCLVAFQSCEICFENGFGFVADEEMREILRCAFVIWAYSTMGWESKTPDDVSEF